MIVEAMNTAVFVTQETASQPPGPGNGHAPPSSAWSPEHFAREQLRGLVRHVFFSTKETKQKEKKEKVRQVVFSAVDPQVDVQAICRQVGEILALETSNSVAVVGDYQLNPSSERAFQPETIDCAEGGNDTTQRQAAIRVAGNLWLVPPARRDDGSCQSTGWLHSYLGRTRREFEYSIVQGRCAAESNEALAMAQFADGIILVLSAQHTRRIAARTIKEALDAAQARLLGTVLSDRVFPIPAAIYRRL